MDRKTKARPEISWKLSHKKIPDTDPDIVMSVDEYLRQPSPESWEIGFRMLNGKIPIPARDDFFSSPDDDE